jgi:hypothetical protein
MALTTLIRPVSLHPRFEEMSSSLSWIIVGLLLVVIPSARPEVWITNTISAVSTAMSADGRVLVTTDTSTLVSCDYGATWHSNNFAGKAAAISANGSNIIVASTVPAQILISADSGANWTPYPAPSTVSARQIASSSDAIQAGMVLFASNPIFMSTNGGMAWSTNNDAPVASWSGIASSADGHRLFASSQNIGLWLSTNSGLNWSSVLVSNNLAGVACSADGKTVVVASGSDVVYVSTDFGGAWSWQHVSTFGGSGAACSADGTRLGVISYVGVFLSANSGLTWTQQTNAGTVLNAITTSADGHRWIAAHSGGQGRLFLGNSTPAPVLQIVPTNGDVLISWIVPSSQFVLEQAHGVPLNPSSWAMVADAPSLNPNTLRNEITVPATNSCALFRLSSQ